MTLNRKVELVALALLFLGIGAMAANVIADEATVTITAKVPLEKAQACRSAGCYIMTEEELKAIIGAGCPDHPVSLRRKAPLL